MASSDLHFAELDENNVVKRVVVVGKDVPTSNGPLGDNPKHVDGETYCHDLLGGTWKQTSYNHTFRKQYSGNGYTYNSAKDIFIEPQHYASWTLDENDDWQAPVPYPTDTTEKSIGWDEDGQKWVAGSLEEPVTEYEWDASGLTWVAI
tara:strand:+ start:40 stop:483 length:444 start_codon:yes stop_codon:yes gene_type:complete